MKYIILLLCLVKCVDTKEYQFDILPWFYDVFPKPIQKLTNDNAEYIKKIFDLQMKHWNTKRLKYMNAIDDITYYENCKGEYYVKFKTLNPYEDGYNYLNDQTETWQSKMKKYIYPT